MSQSRPAASRTTSRQRQSHSRPRLGSRRGTSTHSVPYLPQGPAALILPEGDLGEEAAELIHEFVHPHDHANDPVEPEEPSLEQERAAMARKPWWRRPSPWWYLAMMPLSSIAGGSTIAPRVEILTMLACDHHKPEYTAGHGMEDLGVRLPRWMHRGSDDITIFGDNARSTAVNAHAFWTTDTKANNADMVYFIEEAGGNTTVPNPSMCKSDPVVQRAVTKLTATMATTQGILAVLTVAWWGALSDRVGRATIVGITILGVLVMDFSFIVTALFSKRLPGGYWFLLIGPITEGCLGGLGAASAAVHAYISDTTEPQSRARIFSLNLGVMFTGMAIGPTIGGLLRRHTGSALTVFYFATSVHLLYAIINWTILPESLSPARKRAAHNRHAEAIADARKARLEQDIKGVKAGAKRVFDTVFAFAKPLDILMPKRIRKPGSSGKGKLDLSLTLVAFAYMFVIMVMGSYVYKFQYAQSRFDWTSEELGYWLSSVGAARALYLMIILPIILRLLKPKSAPIQLPVEPEEPLDSSSPNTPSAPFKPSASHVGKVMKFDLGLARVSLVIDIIGYILMPLAPNGHVFTLAAMTGSLGSGFGPALQSIALELYTRRAGAAGGDVGRLFGSLSVLNGIGASIIGPALFGLVYSKTVDVFPQAIFFTTAGTATISFVLLMFVRFPREEEGDEEDLLAPLEEEDDEVPVGSARPRVDREQTLVDTSVVDVGVVPGTGGKTTTTIQE